MSNKAIEFEQYYKRGRYDKYLETLLITQERDLHYQFFTHQHPYVQELIRRLVRIGTTGLLDSDTEMSKDRRSFPGTVQVQTGAIAQFTINKGARISLISTGRHAKLLTPITASLGDGFQGTLVAGITNTPRDGETWTASTPSDVRLRAAAQVQLATSTTFHFDDGSTAPSGTNFEVMLEEGRITVPTGTVLEVVRSELIPELYAEFFKDAYNPDDLLPAGLVTLPLPVKELDFSSSGAYAAYNWELFFHVPLTIALHLSKNQRYAEAQRWFHYLFDPTDSSDGPTPDRFWKVRPFQTTDVKKIEAILVNLVTGADTNLRDETIHSIEAWKDAPFRPHVIARYRQQAYMYKTVMAYLDNLIAWGDSLFRQDTGEAIDEAQMLYVLAANILGPRPLPVPKKGTVRPQNYHNLRHDLQEFGTVMRDLELSIPFAATPFPAAESRDEDRFTTLRSLGKALYFCVPRNDKLLSYWDTVADRLFKIRNSLNLQGIFRQLALFEPPIDPALLARATAAGLDINAIVNGLNQPLPLVRFAFLVQKATELVQEVRTLGSNFLSALEKEEGETLGLLRAKHERAVLELVEQVKYMQLQESIKAKEGLLQTLEMAVQRYSYYERQLGRTESEIEKGLPALEELDTENLKRMKFAMKEPSVPLRDLAVDIAQDLGNSGGKIISSHEAEELSKLGTARGFAMAASLMEALGSGLALIPQFKAHAQPLGCGVTVDIGGQHLHSMASSLAGISRTIADQFSYEASNAARVGNYARREQDWAFQSNLAAGEITQIFKQLRAAQLREAIAEQELKNHRKQMAHAKEIESFLNEEGTQKNGKKTNKAFYTWMKREVKGLYSQCFQFAFDTAKKAERALQHELGNTELTYLKFGYLSGKEGLLAGEKLYFDIKTMELAYHEQNQRNYELTKHVSLLQLDPLALVQLRLTGRCTVSLPETLFDLDAPGHYFRRIKTVALSIPCVVGPYASVNCTLTLLKSSIRTSAQIGDGYARTVETDDARFSDSYGSLQSIVTSGSQNDSGLFETNLRDERYLPFENAGVISEWQLQMPADPSKKQPTQFDYNTISDVILHMRYTAREAGGLLRREALANVTNFVKEASTAMRVRLFSVRHEFPSEWAKFQAARPTNDRFELNLSLKSEHYPYWSRDRITGVSRFDWLARTSSTGSITMFELPAAANDQDDRSDLLTKDTSLGNLLRGHYTGGTTGMNLPEKHDKDMTIYFSTKSIIDLWFAVTWQ